MLLSQSQIGVVLPEVSVQMPVWWSTLYVFVYIYIYMQENCGAHTKSHLALGERSGLRGGMKTKNNIRSTLCGPGSDQLPSVLLLLGLPTASST